MSPQKRVVLYIADLRVGGAERAAINLFKTLPDSDLQVTLLLNQRQGALADTLTDDDAVHSLGVHRTAAAIARLTAYLNRERPAALISYLDFNNAVAVWANILARRPSRVITTHHGLMAVSKYRNYKHRLVPFLNRHTLPLADRVVAVSNGIAQELSETTHRSLALSVIPNPIVPERFRELASAPLDNPWLARSWQPIILGVGRLVPEKNFALLIDAFALLAKRLPARLVLLGDGPLRHALAGKIANYDLASRALLVPADTNPWRYMARADVLVMTSVSEGFGNVLVEAMATGTPVVSVDCPTGPTEILGQGKWGRLVPPSDVESLATAIEETIMRPGDSAPRIARAMEFSAQTVARRYRELIASLT